MSQMQKKIRITGHHPKVVLILDRGFHGFINWLELQKTEERRFMNVSAVMPVIQDPVDPLKRYNREKADESRVYVTAIRYIVENIHAHQKHFKIHAEPVTAKFMKERFFGNHIIAHNVKEKCLYVNKLTSVPQ